MKQVDLRDREIVALTACAVSANLDVAAARLHIGKTTLTRHLKAAAIRLGAVSTIHAVALAMTGGHLDAVHLRERTCPRWPTSAEERVPTSEPLRVDVHRHLIGHPDLTAHEIARVLGRSPGAVAKALACMEEDGEAARQVGQRTPNDTRPSIRWRAT